MKQGMQGGSEARKRGGKEGRIGRQEGKKGGRKEGGREERKEWSEEEREMFQPWKELLVVEKMLEVEGESLRGASILFLSDATAAVRYINKGSGPSEVMSKMMKRIFARCIGLEISIQSDHVAGELMKVSGVDSMSRWSEFAVAKPVYQCFRGSQRWGRFGGAKGFDVDLYASRKSAKCERFCARGGVEGAIGDARTYVCSEDDSFGKEALI